MSRINTNIPSLTAQRVLGQNNFKLGTALERLSTGLQISRGKDDPAGLIASENLRSELAALNSAIGNSERADQVINIAEGGLQEISSMLTELQGLLTQSANGAGLSDEEKEANQLQVDSILQTIDRLSNSTSFQGKKLLNGTFDYQVTGVASTVTDFQINGAKFDGASQSVDATVTQSAQKAGLFLNLGASASGGAGTIDLNLGSGESAFSIEIVGSLGSRELSFASTQTLTQIAAAVNAFTEDTGVVASVSGYGITLSSSNFGSDEYVSVKVTEGDLTDGSGGAAGALGVYQLEATNFADAQGSVASTFANASNPVRDDGQDIDGTINGVKATGDGKELSINTDFLDVQFTLADATSQSLGQVSAFTITGGGADFQLSSDVTIGGKVAIGLQDVATRKLGRSDLGFLDELGRGKEFAVDGADPDLTSAQKIVDQAIKQVSTTRGRLGSFQKNVIGSTTRALGVTVENTAAAESAIRDTDFAQETANLTRNQILVQASTNVLSLANQQPQQVLALLG
ncbi:MAG: hypothetical protein DHS20C14_01010 [Phycisphaeraceae bacterium]|nr:MAG: hypothetical protein DHS20C14_01010 [Phycisphaeraceae bacterium]